MASPDGWIKLHRGILDSEVWGMGPLAHRLWIYLLLQARFELTPVSVAGVEVGYGQYLRSVRKLASDVSWSEEDESGGRATHTPAKSTIHRLLVRFEGMGMISRVGTPSGTLITIAKYKEYQAFSEPASPDVGHEAGQLWDNTKKEKNTTPARAREEGAAMGNDLKYPDGLLEWAGRELTEHVFPTAIQAVAFWRTWGERPSPGTEVLRSRVAPEQWRAAVVMALTTIVEEGRSYDRRFFEKILTDYLTGRNSHKPTPNRDQPKRRNPFDNMGRIRSYD